MANVNTLSINCSDYYYIFSFPLSMDSAGIGLSTSDQKGSEDQSAPIIPIYQSLIVL